MVPSIEADDLLGYQNPVKKLMAQAANNTRLKYLVKAVATDKATPAEQKEFEQCLNGMRVSMQVRREEVANTETKSSVMSTNWNESLGSPRARKTDVLNIPLQQVEELSQPDKTDSHVSPTPFEIVKSAQNEKIQMSEKCDKQVFEVETETIKGYDHP